MLQRYQARLADELSVCGHEFFVGQLTAVQLPFVPHEARVVAGTAEVAQELLPQEAPASVGVLDQSVALDETLVRQKVLENVRVGLGGAVVPQPLELVLLHSDVRVVERVTHLMEETLVVADAPGRLDQDAHVLARDDCIGSRPWLLVGSVLVVDLDRRETVQFDPHTPEHIPQQTDRALRWEVLVELRSSEETTAIVVLDLGDLDAEDLSGGLTGQVEIDVVRLFEEGDDTILERVEVDAPPGSFEVVQVAESKALELLTRGVDEFLSERVGPGNCELTECQVVTFPGRAVGLVIELYPEVPVGELVVPNRHPTGRLNVRYLVVELRLVLPHGGAHQIVEQEVELLAPPRVLLAVPQ